MQRRGAVNPCIESLIERPHVRTVGEIGGFWESYRHVTEGVHVRGNLVT